MSRQRTMALLAFFDLRLPGDRSLFKLFDARQPCCDVVPILPACLAKLVNLGLHLTQRLATFLDLDQDGRDLSPEHGDVTSIGVERLGHLLSIALEKSFGLRRRSL